MINITASYPISKDINLVYDIVTDTNYLTRDGKFFTRVSDEQLKNIIKEKYDRKDFKESGVLH